MILMPAGLASGLLQAQVKHWEGWVFSGWGGGLRSRACTPDICQGFWGRRTLSTASLSHLSCAFCSLAPAKTRSLGHRLRTFMTPGCPASMNSFLKCWVQHLTLTARSSSGLGLWHWQPSWGLPNSPHWSYLGVGFQSLFLWATEKGGEGLRSKERFLVEMWASLEPLEAAQGLPSFASLSNSIKLDRATTSGKQPLCLVPSFFIC